MALKRRGYIACVFLLICALVLSVSVIRTDALAQYGKITGNSVRVRSKASTASDSTVVGSLSQGTIVTLNGTVKGEEAVKGGGTTWYKITSGTMTGYVYGYYLTETSNEVPATDLSFEKQLAAFPQSYQAAIRSLHATYPNWVFIADPVSNSTYKTFDELVAAECINHYKCVSLSYDTYKSWYSMDNGWYNWNTKTYTQNPSGWVGASREVIAYYMDPRNFLNNSDIYMFVQLSYDASTQTKAGLQQLVKGTFLEKTYSDPKDSYNNYVDVIMEAAKQSGVSPYALASTMIQEQGTNGGTTLISGTYTGYDGAYYGYYNFFNCCASGDSVVLNGLKYAKNQGWNTRSKSIFGGAQLLGNSYIGGGQDTYYYKDFDVKMTSGHFKQYAQAVYDAKSSCAKLRSIYKSNYSAALTFKIPVFNGMAATAPQLPAKSQKVNNYYFTELSVSGLSPTFNMYTKNYKLSVSGNTTVSYAVPTGASFVGSKTVSLKQGANTVKATVQSETGYTNTYTLTVTASKACTLKFADPNAADTDADKVQLGDVNGDGSITATDLAKIQLHLLGKKMMTATQIAYADINGDGSITATDLARVQLHLLGKKMIE